MFLAPRLRWWPSGLGIAPKRLANPFAQHLQGLDVFLLMTISFAGVAGYFVCFWPGNRPVRRILGLICLPAMIGLGLMFSRLIYLTAPSSSFLEGAGSLVAHKISWARSLPWSLLPGFHFCLIGLLLIAIYTSRLAFGMAALPLSLASDAVSTVSDQEAWKRVQYLIWALVGPLYLLYSSLAWLTLGLPIILSSHLPAYSQSVWFSRFSSAIETLVVFAVISWIAGKEDRQLIWKTIRVPEPKYAGLSLAIPIGIVVLLSTGQYLFDRAQWAAHNFGNMDPPQFASYFTFPDPWLLLVFFPALIEEMIFRGLLQIRLIQRYGVYRGIFLVGIVWAAFHFFSDFRFTLATDQGAILKLASRIFTCWCSATFWGGSRYALVPFFRLVSPTLFIMFLSSQTLDNLSLEKVPSRSRCGLYSPTCSSAIGPRELRMNQQPNRRLQIQNPRFDAEYSGCFLVTTRLMVEV